jgi:hypothetical protein
MSRRYKTRGRRLAKLDEYPVLGNRVGPLEQTKMRAVALSVVLLAASLTLAHAKETACTPPEKVEPAMLSWLTGEWTNRSGVSEAHQFWSAPINGILVGHEVIATGGATSFAFLRIARGQHGLSLFISLNGADPLEFKAVKVCATQIAFEGKAGAYPHRIVYTNTLTGPLAAEAEAIASAPLERLFRPKPAAAFL